MALVEPNGTSKIKLWLKGFFFNKTVMVNINPLSIYSCGDG
jgi:hypothetical protein